MPIRKSQCCSDFDPFDPESCLDKVVAPGDKLNRMKLVCKFCKRFHKFAKSDSTIQKLTEQREIIDKMVGDDDYYRSLSMESKGFLHDIYDVAHLHPKQYHYLQSLHTKFLHFDREQTRIKNQLRDQDKIKVNITAK